MIPDPFEQIQFPIRRSNRKASWLPVYIEPVVGSGERLCIGVVVADSHEHVVVPVPALDRLACIYGDAAASLSNGAALAMMALRHRLSTEGTASLASLRVPLEGIFTGPVRTGAGESLEDIARTCLTQSASLVERAVEEEDSVEAAERTALSTRRLERLVQETVVSTRPDLANAFNKPFRITREARPMRVGFVGRRLAANFGLLVPGPLATLVNNAKAKLWDLEQLRTGTQAGIFQASSGMNFELLVHRARGDDPQYSDRQLKSVDAAVVELEEEADKVSIRCRPMTSPGQMAEFLLQQEAA
jgi:hypothetical protein